MERWFDVLVTLEDGSSFYDGIWATNSAEAEQIGFWNWETAVSIEYIPEV